MERTNLLWCFLRYRNVKNCPLHLGLQIRRCQFYNSVLLPVGTSDLKNEDALGTSIKDVWLFLQYLEIPSYLHCVAYLQSQGLHIIKFRYWNASGSGSPHSLIPTFWNIGILLNKRAKLCKYMQHVLSYSLYTIYLCTMSNFSWHICLPKNRKSFMDVLFWKCP